jgi:hypothetical protein
LDEDRQIRFLIPPFFLYASLLWWAFIDPYLHCWLGDIAGGGLKELLTLAATAGAVTLPLGYSIGTLGMWLLQFLFLWSKPRQMYEAYAKPECFRIILRETTARDDPTDASRPGLLYGMATFHHELLPEQTRKWVERRWTSFNLAFNSALAMTISLVIVAVRAFYTWPFDPYCGTSEKQWQVAAGWHPFILGQKFWWFSTNALLIWLFIWAARKSWHETMDMIDFQARRGNVYELKNRKQH